MLYHERPATPSPDTWSGFLKNRIGFLEGYVMPKMQELDHVSGTTESIAEFLGWKQNALMYVEVLKRLHDEKFRSDQAILIMSMLPPDRVDLKA